MARRISSKSKNYFKALKLHCEIFLLILLRFLFKLGKVITSVVVPWLVNILIKKIYYQLNPSKLDRFTTHFNGRSLFDDKFWCSLRARKGKKYCKFVESPSKILKFATFFTDPFDGRWRFYSKTWCSYETSSFCQPHIRSSKLQYWHVRIRHSSHSSFSEFPTNWHIESLSEIIFYTAWWC